MSVLAIYDVLKIQEFIFASNKLAENLGASIFVQQVFEERLLKAIEKTVQDEARPRKCWKDATEFEIAKSNSKIQAEVVYIGGGNAMVAYADKKIAIKVTQALSRILLEETGGAIQFAVAYFETDFKEYHVDKEALFKLLNQNKAQRIQSSPLLGIGVTRSGNDGLPSVTFEEDRDTGNLVFLSKVGDLKREIGKRKRDYFDDLLPEHTKDFVFPRDFDEFGQEKGSDENYIAIVHIDGNNQGAMFDSLVKGVRHRRPRPAFRAIRQINILQLRQRRCGVNLRLQFRLQQFALLQRRTDRLASLIQLRQDYQKAVKRIRNASSQIAKTYKNVMKTLVAAIIAWGEEKKFEHFPLRPIVLNGDDVTFVSYGQFGIPLAELFLKELDAESKKIKMPLSACAGVAIVKSHFPFYRAYDLAEDLCDSAKKKAKILAKNHEHGEVGSWLDFHIVQSGVTTELEELRKRFYLIPSIDEKWTEPELLKYPKNADHPDMNYAQYHLLWRPWRIVGNCEECGKLYDWKELMRLWNDMNPDITQPEDQTQWEQSRLKRLRNAMIRSVEELNEIRQEFESRGFKLPPFLSSQKIFKKRADKSSFRQTPYFDALELLEYYEPIPAVKGGQAS